MEGWDWSSVHDQFVDCSLTGDVSMPHGDDGRRLLPLWPSFSLVKCPHVLLYDGQLLKSASSVVAEIRGVKDKVKIPLVTLADLCLHCLPSQREVEKSFLK